ncbi:MAG: hypothetical protein GY835_05575 [bacterium]|nr:hypothetical protein [bacterium]
MKQFSVLLALILLISVAFCVSPVTALADGDPSPPPTPVDTGGDDDDDYPLGKQSVESPITLMETVLTLLILII